VGAHCDGRNGRTATEDEDAAYVAISLEVDSGSGLAVNKKLGPEMLSNRQGAGGCARAQSVLLDAPKTRSAKLTYIEGWRVIALANEVFGFNGWSSEIKNLEVDFVCSQTIRLKLPLIGMQIDQNAETGRFTIGVSAVVRVWLRDGVCREDIGYGKADGLKSKAEALDKVRCTLIARAALKSAAVQERSHHRRSQASVAHLWQLARELYLRQEPRRRGLQDEGAKGGFAFNMRAPC
jgi:DNA recombination protein Rad52